MRGSVLPQSVESAIVQMLPSQSAGDSIAVLDENRNTARPDSAREPVASLHSLLVESSQTGCLSCNPTKMLRHANSKS